jgi:hypothetical protein
MGNNVGSGPRRLDRGRSAHIRDGRADPTLPQPGGDRRRAPRMSGGLPPGALRRGTDEGAYATQFGVEAIIWATLGALARVALYRFVANRRRR